jgi:hypothetical protein
METRLCLVSPWMENGHIRKFLRNNNSTNTDRLSLVRADSDPDILG